MIPQFGSRQRKRSICSNCSLSWVVLVILTCVAGVFLYCLQGANKEVTKLTASLDSVEGQRRSLKEQIDLHQQKLAQLETKLKETEKERDELLSSQKVGSSKLAEAEKGARLLADLNAEMVAAEAKLRAAEKEIKEITVKAGTCQQQFAALNADCATLKQGLVNLGLTSKTVDVSGSVNAGALDPRGGIEAAKVLKDHSQKPWKGAQDGQGGQGASSRVQVQQLRLVHDGTTNYAGTDVDETGPGLEKALAQGAVRL